MKFIFLNKKVLFATMYQCYDMCHCEQEKSENHAFLRDWKIWYAAFVSHIFQISCPERLIRML